MVGDKVGARYIGRCGEMNLDAQIDYLPKSEGPITAREALLAAGIPYLWSAKSRSAPAADECKSVQRRARPDERKQGTQRE